MINAGDTPVYTTCAIRWVNNRSERVHSFAPSDSPEVSD